MVNKSLILILLLSGMTSVYAAPPAGHPSTDETSRIMQLPDAQNLPFQGEVLQAINSNSYTYIQVKMTDSNLWLAAPRKELVAGQRISFPQGNVMHNFYSRKLKRTFESVLFVRMVEILPQKI